MTTTITTLNSQLNTLLEKQASIIRNAEAFAEDLERFETPLKELKKIAAEWNVTPANKTRKANYIAALHIRYEEKNGLAEVNEHIEKLQFQIRCADAQEQANAQQKTVCVIRTIEQTWWVGTEETFNAIYPHEGYEIHFTAHPEVPTVLTQEVKINNITYTIVGRDRQELAQETVKLHQEVNAQWQEVNQMQEETPLQGVASFFSSLAVFASHDILPLNIVGDIELYEQLKAQWDAMDGDALCQCDWCVAEPLQYQEQEELQHAEKEEIITILLNETDASVSIDSRGYVIIRSGEIRSVSFPAREAYALLETLYQAKDVLYQHAQQDESEPTQKSELRQYTEKHLWEHLVESRKGILLGTGLLSWPPSERITGRYGLIALFDETEEPELTDFDYMHTESWISSSWQIDITSLTGKHGSLVVVLDGEEIELGKGVFSIEDIEGIYYVGLIPDEPREEEWLSPTQLHKVDGHITNKPVELWFVEQ